MAANTPLTDAERDTIRAGHAEGRSLSSIAEELGRSKSTVGRHARAMGLTWDTSRTAPATANMVEANRAKRATLEARLLDEAALLLDQLHQPHTAFNFGGKDNTYAEHTLSEPDIGGKRSLIQAAGTAVDKALKLADADRDTTGTQAGRSLVGGLFAFLHGTVPDEDETPTEE